MQLVTHNSQKTNSQVVSHHDWVSDVEKGLELRGGTIVRESTKGSEQSEHGFHLPASIP